MNTWCDSLPPMSDSGRGAGGGPPGVRLTSADRVLFPEDGITKGDLFAYYDAVADALVPHLRAGRSR